MLLVTKRRIVDLEKVEIIEVGVVPGEIALFIKTPSGEAKVSLNVDEILGPDDAEKIFEQFGEKSREVAMRLAYWLQRNRKVDSIATVEELYPVIFGTFECGACKEYREKYEEIMDIEKDIEWSMP